jgi:gliding motility-associated lipoprotein GldH
MILALIAMATSCDQNWVFDDYHDFENQLWTDSDTVRFQFQVADTAKEYRIYLNFRNSREYPWDRVYVNWMLQDSANQLIRKDLLSIRLFEKNGKPLGISSLGSIYDHRQTMIRSYRFRRPGRYLVTFTQMMRVDSLKGVKSVGCKIEKLLMD